MSIDKSLKTDRFKQKRNVRTRRERIQKLIKEARYLKSVYNLPKEKIVRLKIKKLKEEKPKELIPIGYIPPPEERATQ